MPHVHKWADMDMSCHGKAFRINGHCASSKAYSPPFSRMWTFARPPKMANDKRMIDVIFT
jgi:hypothetical protein